MQRCFSVEELDLHSGGVSGHRSGSAAVAIGKRRRAAEQATLSRRVGDIGSAARAHEQGSRPSASERMESLRRRVLERVAGSTS